MNWNSSFGIDEQAVILMGVNLDCKQGTEIKYLTIYDVDQGVNVNSNFVNV